MQFIGKRVTDFLSFLFLIPSKVFRKRQLIVRAPIPRGKIIQMNSSVF